MGPETDQAVTGGSGCKMTTSQQYITSVHGCLRIIELISTVMAFALSFFTTVWLKQSGGGFVTFTVLVGFLFTGVYLFVHLCWHSTLNPKWLLAEWIGYIIVSVLHAVALVLCIYSAPLIFVHYRKDGTAIIQDNSNVIACAFFVFVAMLCYMLETIIMSYKKCRHNPSLQQQSTTDT